MDGILLLLLSVHAYNKKPQSQGRSDRGFLSGLKLSCRQRLRQVLHFIDGTSLFRLFRPCA